MNSTATKSILEEGLADLTGVTGDGARLAVVERDVKRARAKWEDAVIVIVDVDGKAGEGQPTAGMVTDEGAARAPTAVNTDRKQGPIQGGHVVNAAELEVAAGKLAPDSTNAKDWDTAAVGERDMEV